VQTPRLNEVEQTSKVIALFDQRMRAQPLHITVMLETS